ncbi:Parp14 [Symbiodinium sp. CCMP2592]|nr:Parp14 [Symbiodinium sp. CCMP2592]
MSGSASGDSLPTADYYVIGDLVHAEAQTTVDLQDAETQTAEAVSRRLFCNPAGLAAVCLAGTAGFGLACYYLSVRKGTVSTAETTRDEDTLCSNPAEAEVPDPVSDPCEDSAEVLPEIQQSSRDADTTQDSPETNADLGFPRSPMLMLPSAGDNQAGHATPTCDLAAWPQELEANLWERTSCRFGFPTEDRPDVFQALGGWTGAMCLAAVAMLARRQSRAMTVMSQHAAGLKTLEATGGQQHWHLKQQLYNMHKRMAELRRLDAMRCQFYQDTRLARQNMLRNCTSEIKEAKKAVEDQIEKQRRMVADEIQRQLDPHVESGRRLSEEVKANHEATMQQLATTHATLKAATESENRHKVEMQEIQQKHVSEIQELKDSMEDQLAKQQRTAADEIQRQQDRHDEASRKAEEVQANYETTSRQLETTNKALKAATESEQQAASRALRYEQAASKLQSEDIRKQAELSDALCKLDKALAEERKAKDAASGDKAALQHAQARRQQAEEFAKSKQGEAEKAKAERDDAIKKCEEADKERGMHREHILKLESDFGKISNDKPDAAQRRDQAAAERLFAAEDQVKQKEKDAWLFTWMRHTLCVQTQIRSLIRALPEILVFDMLVDRDLEAAKEAAREAAEGKKDSEKKLQQVEAAHEQTRADFAKRVQQLEGELKAAQEDKKAREDTLQACEAELLSAKKTLEAATAASSGSGPRAWEIALSQAKEHLQGQVPLEYVRNAASCLPVVWAWTENTDKVQLHDPDLQQPNDMVLYSATVSHSLELQHLLWHASDRDAKYGQHRVDVEKKLWMEHTGTQYEIFFDKMKQVKSSYVRSVQRLDFASPRMTEPKLQEIRERLEDEIRKGEEAVQAARRAAKKADDAAKAKEDMCQRARDIEKQWADLPDGKPEGREQIPLKWSDMQGETYKEIELRKDGIEYKQIEKYFKQSKDGTVKRICRIQNPTLWMAHKSKETLIKKKPRNKGHANVDYLWHGTTAQAAEKIKKEAGMDTHFSRRGPAHGIYLATRAKYSCQIASHKKIFLCRVELGYIGRTFGNDAQKLTDRPAFTDGEYADSYHYGERSEGHTRHETDTTDQPGQTEYIVFHNAQVYPAYEVEFE